MKGIIYKVTNIINGKVYIGQTTRSLKKRKKEHKYDAAKTCYNSHFHNAIRKYGFNAFKWKIIADTYDRDMLNFLEAFFIDLYNSTNKDKGYNIKEGGKNGKLSNETKKKMSESQKGKVLSEETKKKISEARSANKNENYRNDINEDKVVELYNKGYNTVEIAEKYDCSYNLIRNRLKKKGKILRNSRERKLGNGLFGFGGVSVDKRANYEKKCWRSRIYYNKKQKFLGIFSDPLSAEIFYNFAREEIEKIEKH